MKALMQHFDLLILKGQSDLSSREVDFRSESVALLSGYRPRFADNFKGRREADGERVGWMPTRNGNPGLLIRNPLTGRYILYAVGERDKRPFELALTAPTRAD